MGQNPSCASSVSGSAPTWIAFLRAINTNRRYVKMDVLARLLTEIGYAQVETFIASGNMIFQALAGEPPDPAGAFERQIEAKLQEGLGFFVDTFIRTQAELKIAAERLPFGEIPEDCAMMVSFLKTEPNQEAVDALMTYRGPIDDFAVAGREIYWLRRPGESKFAGATMERAMKMPSTMRNITTVVRMAERWSS